MSDYVSFLTTKGSHCDSYAESFHRAFFSSWQDARPTSPSEVKQTHPPTQALAEFPSLLESLFFQVLAFAEKRSRRMLSSSSPDGQLDAIGCLPMTLPFILLSASANEDQAVGLPCTRNDPPPSLSLSLSLTFDL